MNSKKAHEKLKDINKQRNAIGIGSYKDSRRRKCEQHEIFNKAMVDLNKSTDEAKLKEIENDD